MSYGLRAGELKEIQKILSSSADVEQAILYGSRAMGTQRPGSDIDLVLVGQRVSHRQMNRIALALDDLLLPYQFDLSLLHQIDNPDLLDHIRRVGVVIYEKQTESMNK